MSIAQAPSLAVPDIRWTDLGNQVHVWILPPVDEALLDANSPWLDLLSPDELARAHRFHFARHARSFATNRARLRLLLGAYLDRDPRSLVFNYGSQGKPLIDSEPALHFNLSHTDDLAVAAFSATSPVGIDVERIRETADLFDVARQYFSEHEFRTIAAIPNEIQQRAAFYRCWTRKEAFLKALGEGLSRPLGDFTVSCEEIQPALLDCQWDPADRSRWQLLDLKPAAGYAAALAYQENSPCPGDLVQTLTWGQD